ncbi:MAG: DNA cytosine methyltransferase [Phormidium tanganyikae FI6-MK23]|jgi:DNA (cytosine-5)-methyltransferase 1|nr:DNA cytosine methyltransferase [Phormidium tanganyikae FI6-MK23]
MRAIDLFAGCGGLSRGFQNSGFDVVAAFDNWKEACGVYAINFKHPIFEVDLSLIEDTSFFKEWKPEIILGGPPCQDFSSAGKRDESQGRADLTITYAKIIAAVKPEWFLMENVERIKKSQVLQEAISILKASGYGISSTVLDASYCGVPQIRKRFILAGHLHSKDGFLDRYLRQNQSKKRITVHDYMGDKLDIQFYYRHPRSYARRGIFTIYEPSATIRGVNRPVPENYKKHKGDLCDPKLVRPLTTLERSCIQTFPEDFKWVGTKTTVEQLIGNAVPVKLAEYIANCFLEYIADEARETQLQLFEGIILL